TTASTAFPTGSVNVATISQDTTSAYISSQSNGSQIKFEDINQIDEDDIEEIDIKWNMALLSMRADKFWKRTGKKISIQGSYVAGFEKSKVECFNCHKMGHFARECTAARNQERGRKESYRQGSRAEEKSSKALMAIDGVGWDWSYMQRVRGGTKDAANQEVKKDESSLRYIVLPNWAHDALLESTSSKPYKETSTQVPKGSARPISKRVANQEETPSLDNILSMTNRFEDILGVSTSLDETIEVEADNVWTLVDCPKKVKPIGTKWVLKNKKDERGIVVRNKARLVAQGHTQEERIDYDEVFAPVARIEAIRLFLAYASFIGFTVYQMDVKSAFLYGTIDEEDKYIGDILKKFGFSDVRSSNTPIDKENPWGKDGTGKDVELHLYRSMIGSLMYLTESRPDIMFAVCAYGHPKLGLWYPKASPFDLVAYSDSDYSGASQDRKSTTGGSQFLGRRIILWQCKKQTIVATSTTEAEYVAAASCCG
nr:ribonuclease H-like domain, reverse transcriptase, RNA-dependent DNA polymerase [Tanacetum cinerariifolium]